MGSNRASQSRGGGGKHGKGTDTQALPTALAIEQVPVGSLTEYPDNPRIGDVGMLVESLELHGQYKPIVVQRSTNHVIAGNHTLKAAQHLKWKTIAAVYLDVDDEQARRILVMDNRASDVTDYDWEALAQVLQSLPDAIGTGYTSTEIDALVSEVLEAEAEREQQLVDDIVRLESVDTDDEEEDTTFDEVELPQSVFQLADDVWFDGDPEWGIPMLDPEMLVQDLPSQFEAWAGEVVTPDDPDTNWLYVYASDSARGLPWDRTTLCFYSEDDRFERWWADPSDQFTKALAVGVTQMVEHNFSVRYEMPVAMKVWQSYRTRWLARYAQMAGIKVIPDIKMHSPEAHSYLYAGYPDHLPVAMTQTQAQWHKYRKADRGLEQALVRVMRQSIEYLTTPPRSIGTLAVYGGELGHQLVRDANLPVDQIVYLDTRQTKRDAYRAANKLGTRTWVGKR